MKLRLISILFVSCVCGAQPLFAADRLELDETAIQGAQELPKVLYVVPWKKSAMDDKPVEINSIADEVMTPVDREVLRRQIHYLEGTGKVE